MKRKTKAAKATLNADAWRDGPEIDLPLATAQASKGIRYIVSMPPEPKDGGKRWIKLQIMVGHRKYRHFFIDPAALKGVIDGLLMANAIVTPVASLVRRTDQEVPF